MTTNRIVERVPSRTFRTLILQRPLVIGAHARDHLSLAQREIYTDEMLRRTLRQTAALVGRQENERYVAFYRRKDNYIKMIVADKDPRLELVTFINTRVLPSIGRDK
jgi:hypothetical protein